MNNRRGFNPEQFFGPEGPFGPRGPLGPGGIFGPQGPMGTGGAWPSFGGFGGQSWQGEDRGRQGTRGPRRARRGDVRTAILEALTREPMNGYQLMQAIAEATDGAWTPSSGAVYPALSQLEDEGMVTQIESDGRKVYQLTDSGRQAASRGPSLLWGAQSNAEPDDPWSEEERGSRHTRHGHGGPRGRSHGGPGSRHGSDRRSGGALWKALGSVAIATQAVGQSGDDGLVTDAAELLDRARRDLYRLLAESEVAREDRYDEGDQGPDGREDEIAEGEIIED